MGERDTKSEYICNVCLEYFHERQRENLTSYDALTKINQLKRAMSFRNFRFHVNEQHMKGRVIYTTSPYDIIEQGKRGYTI